MQPNIIKAIVAKTNGLRGNMRLATQPCFMIADGDHVTKCQVPVCLSFLGNDQAKPVLLTKTFFIDGIPCTARPYTERPPIVYCHWCSLIRHRENSWGCKGPRCEICTSSNHSWNHTNPMTHCPNVSTAPVHTRLVLVNAQQGNN